MSSLIFSGQVTVIPADWANDVNRLVYDIFGAAQTKEGAIASLGLGTMARQNNTGVNIQGGLLDNVTIGNQWPGIGKFYSLSVLSAPTADNDVVTVQHLQQTLLEAAVTPLTTKGDLLTHDGNEASALPVGTDNFVLTADAAEPSGMKWAAVPTAATLPGALRGDILVHNGTSGYIVLNSGLDGQFLVANSATASGLSWVTFSPFVPPVTTKGDLMVRGTSAVQRVPVGTNGQVLVANSSAAQGVEWADPVAATPPYVPPVTTKGDLFTYGASATARLPVGVDGYILSANSAESTGLAWVPPAAGTYTSPLTDRGDVLSRNSTGHARLALGTENQVLTVAPASVGSPTGLYWAVPMAPMVLKQNSLTTNLAAGPNYAYQRAPQAFTALEVRAALLNGSTSGDVVIDILVNGVSILSTKITIEAGTTTSFTAAIQPVISVPAIPDDAMVSVSVLSPGTNARGLSVIVKGR